MKIIKTPCLADRCVTDLRLMTLERVIYWLKPCNYSLLLLLLLHWKANKSIIKASNADEAEKPIEHIMSQIKHQKLRWNRKENIKCEKAKSVYTIERVGEALLYSILWLLKIGWRKMYRKHTENTINKESRVCLIIEISTELMIWSK